MKTFIASDANGAVDPQPIELGIPQGAGKVQGTGESFSVQRSRDAPPSRSPVALPDGRGDVHWTDADRTICKVAIS